LRADLVVGRGASVGVFEVRDPRTGKQLVLYDFELSVARMLDGRRTVHEVIEIGERLGIPIDPDGLSRFQQELQTSGFLGAPGNGAAPGSKGPWSTRRVWDEKTRDRFRSGVKLMRSGRPEEAVACFDEVLANDPENPEALELLALIAAGHALAARPIGELFQRQDRRAAHPRRFPAATAALVVVLAGGIPWAALSFTRSIDRGADVAASALAAETSPRLRHRAAASDPSPAVAQPVPAASTPPATPPRASLRTIPIERRWHPALVEIRAPATGIVGWSAPVPLRVARGERLGEVRGLPASPPRPEELKHLHELEKLAAEDPVYQEFLDRERAALAGGGPSQSIAVTAPADGQLTPVVHDEARVATGDLVARILDPGSWRVSVLLRGAPPPSGAACEVAGDGDADRAPCQIVEAKESDGASAITLAVSSRTAPWLEFARSPYVRLGADEARTVAPR